MDILSISPQMREMIENELEPNERVVWVGQPIARLYARRFYHMTIFSIPWTAFAIFVMAGMAGFKIPQFNAGKDLGFLFGIPFIFVGVLLFTAPLWAMLRAKSIAYIVTDRRAVILKRGLTFLETGIPTLIRSFTPEKLAVIHRKQMPNGSGDLLLDREVVYSSVDTDHESIEHGFLAIEDVQSVEAIIRRLAGDSITKRA